MAETTMQNHLVFKYKKRFSVGARAVFPARQYSVSVLTTTKFLEHISFRGGVEKVRNPT